MNTETHGDLVGEDYRAASGRGVRAERAADHVFRTLAAEILRGEREPGSSLPPEKEIARRFDVSRIVARQALYLLAELDLVAVRQGRPTVVLDPDDALDLRVTVLSVELAANSDGDLRDLAEVVVLHVGNLLELAEPRITDPEIEGLESLMAGYEAAGKPASGFAELEERFWTGVAAAARNRMLLKQTRWWFRFLGSQQPAFTLRKSPPELLFPLYREVFDFLKRRAGAADRYRQLAAVALDRQLGPRS